MDNRRVSFSSILRSETGGRNKSCVGSKLSLVRDWQVTSLTTQSVRGLVRYWTLEHDEDRDISISTNDEDDDDGDKRIHGDCGNFCSDGDKADKSKDVTPAEVHCSTTPTKHPLTLVRGSSMSLVDIPTFLSPRVALGTVAAPPPLYDPRKILEDKLAEIRARRNEPKMGKRSQWTVMCVAIGFFSSCLVLVGGMLSITSDYQDRAITKMLNISFSQHTLRQSS